MKILDVLYARAPYFIQCLAANYAALWKERQRWNGRVRELLKLYQELDYQDYDGCYDRLLRPDLAPYTASKAVVKQNMGRLVDRGATAETWFTSGTSGSGLNYPVSLEFINQLWAFYWKFRGAHGVTHDDWFVYFIGKPLVGRERKAPPYWIYSYPTRQLLMSQYHLGPQTCRSYLEEIARSSITCMHGYPSMLGHFASLIEQAGLVAISQNCGIRFISCSSEKLVPRQRELIERVFGCRVVQIYGMTEGVVNAYECDRGRIHIDDYFAKVEFEPTDDQGVFRMRGSSYHNAALPLYRYAIGDLVRLSNENSCPCGRKGRLLDEILGREDDYVSYPDGRRIGRLDHIFKKLVNVLEAQIVQAADYALEFRIVKGPHFSAEDEAELREEIHAKLGDDLAFKVTYLSAIPRTASGKLKAVVSEARA